MTELTDDPIPQAWLRNWQHTEASRDSPPIDLNVSRKEWCDIVRHASERKSSSPSGVHLGHTHAWTRIKSVARLRSEMDLFPHQHGFAPKSWQQIVDVMLEKTPGCPHSHKLRLVALLESKFNISLRAAVWPHRLKKAVDLDFKRMIAFSCRIFLWPSVALLSLMPSLRTTMPLSVLIASCYQLLLSPCSSRWRSR